MKQSHTVHSAERYLGWVPKAERSLSVPYILRFAPSYYRTIELFIKTTSLTLRLTPGSRQLVNSLLTSYKALGAVCFNTAACSLQSFSKT